MILPLLLAVSNIVLILTDDQRQDTVGMTHGVNGPAMPIVQALANSGTTFTNARTVDSLCSPSRASLLTGLYVHNHGVLRNDGTHGGAGALDDSSTLATWLHDAGYRTALVGKYLNSYNLISPYIPPGWDDWRVFVEPDYYDYDLNENGQITHHGHAESDYSTDVLKDRALDFIDQSVASGQPFFLLFSTRAPHNPAVPANRHIGAFANLAPWRPASYNENDVSDKPKWVRDLPKLTPAEQAEFDATFRADMEMGLAVDEAVGAIMNHIPQDTLVIYTSDNGYSWGEHRWRTKQCGWEECVRVPLAMWGPGIPQGSNDDLVLNVDLAPTIAAVVGISIPPTNGMNILPLLGGGSWRPYALAEHWRSLLTQDIPKYYSITSDQWKLIDNVETGQSGELYNLLSDPLELTSVANKPENQQIKQQLYNELQALRAE